MPCYNNIIKNTRDTKHYEQMIPNQMINKLKDCEVDFMKAVIAIDSFKGSLSSFEAGNSAAEGIRRVYPDAQIEVRPLADGGEGTVEALTLGCAGQLTTVTVTGPLGKPVSCQYGIVDSTRTAIIEMSGAAGITLVPDTERNPLYTTTYGVGEVIRDAITKAAATLLWVSAAVPPMTAVPVCYRPSVSDCLTKTAIRFLSALWVLKS